MPHDRPLVLLYVADTRPAEDLGYIARRLHRDGGARHDAAMHAAESAVGSGVLAEAEAQCRNLGYSEAGLTTLARRGRPEQEIIAVASQADLGIGLVVIGSSYKRGPNPATGPASVGHVARFVVDHSPCDVLLLR